MEMKEENAWAVKHVRGKAYRDRGRITKWKYIIHMTSPSTAELADTVEDNRQHRIDGGMQTRSEAAAAAETEHLICAACWQLVNPSSCHLCPGCKQALHRASAGCRAENRIYSVSSQQNTVTQRYCSRDCFQVADIAESSIRRSDNGPHR
jgi:hypothetical protein